MKKRAAGIILSVLSLGALGFWELWGRENISYDTVLVLAESVAPNTLIREDMLRTKKTEKMTEGALLPEDAKTIEGLQTKQFVAGGSELFIQYFEPSDFAADEENGRYILSVPDSWLQTCPQTIKRGDRVFFCCGGEITAEAVVVHVRDGTNQEVRYGDWERNSASASVSLLEVIVSEEEMKTLGALADKGNKFILLYH